MKEDSDKFQGSWIYIISKIKTGIYKGGHFYGIWFERLCLENKYNS